MNKRELVIVGGGPAGMAAALSASKAGIKDILILERAPYPGGVLNQCIHTGFGLEYFGQQLTGPEYAQRFIDQIDKREIEVRTNAFVVKLTKEKEITFLIPGAIEKVSANAIIMATGCRERTREMIPVHGCRPAGVLPAGLAQQMINMHGWLPGKKALIIGSGDIGLIMARRLTLEGTKVEAVIEIMPQSKGLARNVAQCLEDFNIPLLLEHQATEIHGKDRVERVTVNDIKKNTEFDVECDTVLMSVGLIPENELIEQAGFELDKRTNTPLSEIKGIYTCGNCHKIYDLVDEVTIDSEKTGIKAAAFFK